MPPPRYPAFIRHCSLLDPVGRLALHPGLAAGSPRVGRPGSGYAPAGRYVNQTTWVRTRIRGSAFRRGAASCHRIALTAAVLTLVADGPTELDDASCMDVSFPGFGEVLRGLGAPGPL